jgi:hypothetical protein
MALYKNDNDNKLAIIAVIFAMIIFTLVSCGKEMRELRGGTQDIARNIYERAGIDARNMEETPLSAMDSYMIGIDEEDFRENVEKACVYRPSLLSAEQSLCVVIAKNEDCAEEIFEEMAENYEWAPCDPARSAVFMCYGKYVLLGKDSESGARAVSEAFAAETGGRARTDFSQNPM